MVQPEIKFYQTRCLVAHTGVHSACRREENGHNLDIWVLRLRLGQIFLGLKVGEGLDFQISDLNRAHETEKTVFPIPQVFTMCRRRLRHAMNTL